MNDRHNGQWLLACGLALSLLLAGCGTTPPTRFYQLTPHLPAAGEPQAPLSELAVGVGPVRLADYLGRSQIVLREQQNRLTVREFERWGGSLETNIALVMAENLSLLLGTDSSITFPWDRELLPDYQVIVEIRRLDADEGNRVHLVAVWQVLLGNDRTLLSLRRSEIKETVADTGVETLVAAKSRALGRLSAQIAGTIRQHHAAAH